MGNKLLTYLQGISSDAAELKLFHSNPAKAAHNAGLSPTETAALISKNPAVISKVIKAGGHINANDDVNVTIVVVVAP